MAVTTKTRIEAFRRLADSLLRKQKGFKTTDEVGLLFEEAEITDAGASAARDALVETTLLTGLKDGWTAITSAAETQIRRLRKAKLTVPPQLGTLISEIDQFRAVSVGTGVVHCRPFLRWVGGKDLLAGVLAGLVRERLAPGKMYLEPFLGSGAVFLALAPEQAILADSIEPLIETWKAIQKVPEKVSGALDRLVLQGATEERFKAVRDSSPRKTYDVAARFIYLNWTAFNGLYRVNREGKFNVSWGRTSSPKFPTLGELTAASKALEGADLVRWDYQQTLKTAAPGDCVYIDPPKAEGDGPLDLSTLVGEVLRLTGEGVGVVVSATVDSPLREMLLPRGFNEVLLADTRGKGAPRQVALVSRRSNDETR
jgi:DNA adenine methylase Dam